jgi:hypothetical protein
MPRTDAAEVKKIIETTLTNDDVTDGYITGANLLVTEVIGTSSSISEALKTEIEKWLTAHMIASTRERMAKKAKAGSASIEYLGEDGLKLESTPYGQQVLVLDITGKFAKLGKKSVDITAVES